MSVASGKGGVGKTFISASLGLLLSKQRKVNLVDADLGTPNLHTFLGLRHTKSSLDDFLSGKVENLSAVADEVLPTLRLVAGAESTYGIDSVKYFQKRKLLRHILAISDTPTILDLGAGVHFDILDFFIISDKAILVVNPDPAAIENLYQFLKSASLRVIKFVAKDRDQSSLFRQYKAERHGKEIDSLRVVRWFQRRDRRTAAQMKEALNTFSFHLIVNRARTTEDYLLGDSLSDVVRRFLALRVTMLGTVPEDPRVYTALQDFVPYVERYPASRTTKALRVCVEKLFETRMVGAA
jgi:flagellar biosynthesis protein FlhG